MFRNPKMWSLFLAVLFLSGCSNDRHISSNADISYESTKSCGEIVVDVNGITADLRSNDWKIRRRASDAIPWRSDSSYTQVMPLLLECLASPHESLQLSAINALHDLSYKGIPLPAQTYSALTKVITSNACVENRRWAIMTLGNVVTGTVNESDSVILLTKQLSDPEDDIFHWAVDVLGEIGPNAVTAVPEIIRQLKTSPYRAMLAAGALGDIHSDPDRCVPALIEALHQPDASERIIAEALAAFESAAAPALPDLIRLLGQRNGNIVNAAALAIGNMGLQASAAAEPLANAFMHAGDRREVKLHTVAALCSIGPKGQRALAACLNTVTTFQVSDVGFNSDTTAMMIQALVAAPGLIHLDLAGATIDSSESQPLSQMRQLQDLVMPKDSGDAHLAHVSGLTKLRRLSVGNLTSDAGMQSLSGLHDLRSLQIGASISGAGFQYLAAANRLEVLKCKDLNDRSLRHLQHHPALHTLWIPCRNISNASVLHLGKLPALQDLNLSHSAIDDDGIREIAKQLPQLRKLQLNHCRITEACVDSLCHLKQLSELSVYATPLAGQRHVLNMSKTAAVQRLRLGLPGCSIIYAD